MNRRRWRTLADHPRCLRWWNQRTRRKTTGSRRRVAHTATAAAAAAAAAMAAARHACGWHVVHLTFDQFSSQHRRSRRLALGSRARSLASAVSARRDVAGGRFPRLGLAACGLLVDFWQAGPTRAGPARCCQLLHAGGAHTYDAVVTPCGRGRPSRRGIQVEGAFTGVRDRHQSRRRRHVNRGAGWILLQLLHPRRRGGGGAEAVEKQSRASAERGWARPATAASLRAPPAPRQRRSGAPAAPPRGRLAALPLQAQPQR